MMNTPQEKKCTRCQIVKNLADFRRQKSGPLGRQTQCRACRVEIGRNPENLKKMSEYHRQHYVKNRDKLIAYQRAYSADAENKQKIVDRRKRKRKDVDFLIRESENRKAYTSRPEVRIRLAEYHRNKRRTDVNHRLANNLRKRRWEMLKRQQASVTGHMKELLGVSLLEFRAYLESKFYPHPKTNETMTWENYGSRWHIDEVIPCSAWDLQNPLHQRLCFRYDNAQPLWAEENISKGGVNRKGGADTYRQSIELLVAKEVVNGHP